MSSADPRTGRFRSQYDPLTLITVVVPEIARKAAEPDLNLQSVTQRGYDLARAHTRFPDAPSADATARRLGYAWQDLLDVALDGERSHSQNIGAANRRDARPRIPPVEAAAAIRLISTHARSDDLNPGRYDALRDELVAADGRSWLHGGRLDEVLPTSDQIRLACRTHQDPEGWLSALSLAGQGRRVAPRNSVPVSQALEWFLEDAGWLPAGHKALRAYARAKGFALKDTGRRGISRELTALRDARAERGLWSPPRTSGRRPRFEVVPFERAPRAARVAALGYDQLVDVLVWALNDTADDGVLTQDAYQAWCNGRPHAPALRTLQRVAGTVGKTFVDARTDALHHRAGGGGALERPAVVVLDLFGIGEDIIVIVPEPRRPRQPGRKQGRPRLYATDEERNAARRERRRRAHAAKAEERRRERERRLEKRRRQGPVPRRQYRRSDGRRIEWRDLIEAGLVTADTEIFNVYRGQRYMAQYDGSGFLVPGYGTAQTLSGAASLIVGGVRDGWAFWRVGAGKGVPVRELRTRMHGQLAAEDVN